MKNEVKSARYIESEWLMGPPRREKRGNVLHTSRVSYTIVDNPMEYCCTELQRVHFCACFAAVAVTVIELKEPDLV